MTQMSKRNRPPAVRSAGCAGLAGLLQPRFFKALCDPNRIAILIRLAGCGRACTVGEIASCCPVDISVVSRHLTLLREAGVVEAQRRGKEVYYHVRFDLLVPTLRQIADAVEACSPPIKPPPRKKRRSR